MYTQEEDIQASAAAAFLIYGQLDSPKDGVADVDHSAQAVHHIAGHCKFERGFYVS